MPPAQPSRDRIGPEARPAVAELGLGAQLVLCAARGWHTRGARAAASPCALFRCAGLSGEAFPAFACLLGLLDAFPEGPRFGAMHDASLSPGEEGLIAAIGALQEGAPWRAQRVVSAWVRPPAVPRVVALLAILARCLAGAGLRLAPAGRWRMLH